MMDEWRDTSRLVRPWLYHRYPNLFILYAVTVVFHFSVFVNWVRVGFDNPALHYVNHIFSPPAWAWGNLACGIVMVAGLFRPHFNMARFGLACGSFLTGVRTVVFINALFHGYPVGEVAAGWAVISAAHISQTLSTPIYRGADE